MKDSRTDEPSHAIRKAWQAHIAHDYDGIINATRTYAAEFIAQTYARKNKEEALAVLLVALRSTETVEALLQGKWISFANVERYLYLDAKGWGDTTTLTLVEQFIVWVAEELEVSQWRKHRLLHMVDDAREAHGISRRTGSRALDRTESTLRTVDGLSEDFAKTCGDAFERAMVPSVVQTIAASIECSTGSKQGFGAVDEADCIALLTCLDPASTEDEHDANRFFMVMAARFYQWLGHRGLLASYRAEEVAQIFFKAATQCIRLGRAS